MTTADDVLAEHVAACNSLTPEQRAAWNRDITVRNRQDIRKLPYVEAMRIVCAEEAKKRDAA